MSRHPRPTVLRAFRIDSVLLSVVLSSLLPGLLVAQDAARLRDAARVGDLEAVRAELAAGAPVEEGDRYAATALFKAAAAGRLEVVDYLLEQGADANVTESFWGQRMLDAALAGGHYEVASRLLAAGAEGREDVFGFVLGALGRGAEDAERRELIELAKVAVESGPFYATGLARLRDFAQGGELAELASTARPRPDPAPPSYTVEQLSGYVGSYEGWSDDTRVEATLEEGRLRLAVGDGDPVAVEAVAENRFAADGVEALYFGRFGSIEGMTLIQGERQTALRRSVAEPVDVPTAESRRAASRSEEPVRRTVHWPGFRGPNGDGIGDGDDAPVRWNVETGENVAWKADIPGLGNSSPVVWGDQVYLTTAVATGIEQEVVTGDTGSGADVDESVEHSWRVLAFDKRTGEALWSTEVGRGVPLTRRHFKGSQANSTVVSDGERIVAVFPTAGMACLDREGKILWRHDLGPLNASNFFDPDDQWGFASSPILYRDLVILQVDVYGGGYLAAWRLEDGEQVWKTPRSVAPSWSTPSILHGERGDELIANASMIKGYDPATGEELWSLGPNSELVIARPVIGDGVAYVSAGYPPVKPVYAIRAGLRGDIEVTPGEEHGALLWSHRIGGAYMPSPLLYRGLLYVVHHNGRIVAYDAIGGDALYKKRFSRGGTFTGSAVANNGRLYIPTEDGLLYVVAAGPDYEELAVNEMGEPLMATPALSEGTLLLRTPRHLYALRDAAPQRSVR